MGIQGLLGRKVGMTTLYNEDGTVDAVVNTVTGDRQALQDGFHIRRAAVERRIPCFTSMDTARAAVESLAGGDSYNVKPLRAYLGGF
mgnify:CR=1 FL=1